MKKNCSILLFLLVAIHVPAQTYYRSNLMGEALAEIKSGQVSSTKYALRIDKKGETETRTLLISGKENRKWITTHTSADAWSVLEYSGETLTNGSWYENGTLVREIEYEGGRASMKKVIGYENGRIREVIFYDGSDTLVRTDRYIYGPSGALVQLVQNSPDGAAVIIGYTYAADGKLLNHYVRSAVMQEIYEYTDGKVTSLRHWENDILVFEESTVYSKSGRTVVRKNAADSSVFTTSYDLDGNPLKEELKRGSLIQTTEYSYRSGKLWQKTARSPGKREKWEYIYHFDTLLQEIHSVDDVISETSTYLDKTAYYIEYYRNGKPVLRVYYKDDLEVRSEYLAEQSIEVYGVIGPAE